jgi:cell division protein FtsW
MNPPKRGTPDFILLALTFLLVGFGIVMVFSASSAIAAYHWNDSLFYTRRQIVWAILGMLGMLLIMNIPYAKLKRLFVPFFFTAVIMLVLVLFSEPVNGARSWLIIGGVRLGQPAEFAKLAMILYLAALISKKGEKFRDLKKGLMPVLITAGGMAGLIMLQPDIGTALIFLVTAGVIIFAGGANVKHLLFIGAVSAGFAAFVAGIYLLVAEEHSTAVAVRLSRLTSFLDPWSDPLASGYHLIQSLFALGHGGLTGAGFGQSIQKLHYLPYAHNDFIFAIIAEELGFIGGTLFLLTYLLFLWRGLLIALKCGDLFGTLLGTGIVAMFSIQALVNIGGVTGSIPITGVTLPFISYGGSSLLVSMWSVGILLSISRENNRLEKEKNQGAASAV